MKSTAWKYLLSLLATMFIASVDLSAAEVADSVSVPDINFDTPSSVNPDSLPKVAPDWWSLLWSGKLNLKDKSVRYPKFVGFCVDVYNWADTTFNSYDDDYVIGTGYRWKAYVKSDNWTDSYAMRFEKKMNMRMMSEFYCNVGFYLQYMAVSLGYSLDMSHIIGNRPSNHKKMEFSFNCARFNAELYYNENTGGTYIRTFGDYKGGHLFKMEFPGLTLTKFGVNGYYFFNNRRYSQGAAYNFSKYQLKTAGSIIAGFSYTNQNIRIDLNELPAVLKPYLTTAPENYRFHYDNYSLIIGYGRNFVWRKGTVFNFTALPLVGFNHCYEDATESRMTLFSLGIDAHVSYVINLKDFYIGLIGRFTGDWYNSDQCSLFSAIENLSISAGVRF